MTPEERIAQLEAENLKMRNAMSFAYTHLQSMENYSLVEGARHMLLVALEYKGVGAQLQRERDADLAVIEAAEDTYNAMTNSMVQASRERLKNALAEREKVYGEKR